jgi:hypothetical protein
MSDDQMFLYAGEYDSVEDAKADLEELKELHSEKFVDSAKSPIGSYGLINLDQKSPQCVSWRAPNYGDSFTSKGHDNLKPAR